MCAYKALHGRTAACPLCRSPQPSPQQPEDLPLAQNRADAIAARYPAEVLRERAEAAQAEREVFERELARRREFHFFVMHAPGFGVRSASALHLFEPRYRLLAARAIAENDGRFGFVTSGSPTVGAVGVSSCFTLSWFKDRGIAVPFAYTVPFTEGGGISAWHRWLREFCATGGTSTARMTS